MHKRNSLQTDSIRLAKVTQSALEAIDDRIEKEKSRRIRHVNYAKIRMWNELKSIHKVFVPQYVPNSEKGKSTIDVNKTLAASGKPDKKRRAKTPKSQLSQRAMGSIIFPKKDKGDGKSRDRPEKKLERKPSCIFQPPSVDDDDDSGERRKRSQTWPVGLHRAPAREETRADSQEYVNKLLQANAEPCVSVSMSAVTNSYLMFKRLLRRRQSAAATETQYVSRTDASAEECGQVLGTAVPPGQMRPKEVKTNLAAIAEDAKEEGYLPVAARLGSRRKTIPLLKNNFVNVEERVVSKVAPVRDAPTGPSLEGMPKEPRGRAQSLTTSLGNDAGSLRRSRYLPKRNHEAPAVSFIFPENSLHSKRPALRPRALSDPAAPQSRGALATARLSAAGMLTHKGLSPLCTNKVGLMSRHITGDEIFLETSDRQVKTVKFSDLHK